MGEISLICPGCAAEYRVPDTAIPEGGRDVECTACSRVWFVPGPYQQPARTESESRSAIPAPPQPAQDQPAESPLLAAAPILPAKRRLPESVLNILRDEVEHERRARMAEDEVFAQPTREQPAALSPSPIRPFDNDWPATTVVTPAAEPHPLRPALAPVSRIDSTPRKADAPISRVAEPREALQDPAPMPAPVGAARAIVTTAAPQPDMTADPGLSQPADKPLPTAGARTVFDQQPARSGREGYPMGLGLAAMIALGGLTLYLLAPGLADAGSLGSALTGFREWVDGGRQWLQTAVDALTG